MHFDFFAINIIYFLHYRVGPYMSKAFGMAGLRIGWVVCQDKRMLKKIEYMKHYTSICNSAPSEILTIISLRNKDVILKRNNQIVTDNLKLLDQFFYRLCKYN
jgi:aspartate/methionine/tyrosine aminotransferase